MPKSRQSTIRPHEQREDELAALNVRLAHEINARARAEKDRAEMERQLREVRERFESGFVNAPIGMAVVDMNGAWLQVNDALCRITGYAERDLKATMLDAITHPEDVEHAKDFATRLRSRGCQFALDDFGAGFGSFYYLKNFPFDYIKIDGGFIRSLVSSPMDQLVVQAIVTIAQGLGKRTVAEFVTDQATAGLLLEIGVDCAQGYYIGEPRPITEALRSGHSPKG